MKELKKKIKEKTEEEMWLCPYCGYRNLESDMYCFECGKRREEYEEEEQRPKRIVPY